MRKYKRLQQRIHGTLPRTFKVKAGTVAVRKSICGAQCSGQIKFERGSPLDRKRTFGFSDKGERVVVYPHPTHVLNLKSKYTGQPRYRRDEQTGQIWRAGRGL